ncbi:hypothetical protein [Bradyrhizobium sp. HKCCYLS3013]|uniref:hypothetical protein n=1 Tax=Bradyrhizobium sp. HKCCYLS3013 TaxID=3420735 RepID=UPI003EBA6095
MSRSLPENVLRLCFIARHRSLESQQVQQKYSNPRAEIGEHSLDYVLLIYLNPEALLFWMPKLFDYLKTRAPRDTFHYDVVMMKLANQQFSEELRAVASDCEREMICQFLIWMAENIELSPSDLTEHQLALKHWSL